MPTMRLLRFPGFLTRLAFDRVPFFMSIIRAEFYMCLNDGTVYPSHRIDFLRYHIYHISFFQLTHTLYILYTEKI